MAELRALLARRFSSYISFEWRKFAASDTVSTIDYLFSFVSTLMGTCWSAAVSHYDTSPGWSMNITHKRPISSVKVVATSRGGTSKSDLKYVSIIAPPLTLKNYHMCY